MNRRGFMGGILALGAAPAIVRADSLMRVIPRNHWISNISTRPADLLEGPFPTITRTGITWGGRGLLVSNTIPGAVRLITFGANLGDGYSVEYNPGELPEEYRDQAAYGCKLKSIKFGPNLVNDETLKAMTK